MQRFEFDREGVKKYTTAIYGLGDEQLHDEAIRVAEDFLAHIASRFALPVYQLEYLRSLNRNLILILGWHLAAAMVCRRPVDFIFMQDGASVDFGAKCMMATSKMAVHYGGGIMSSEGMVTIQFCDN